MENLKNIIRFPPRLNSKRILLIHLVFSFVCTLTLIFGNSNEWLVSEAGRLILSLLLGNVLIYVLLLILEKTVVSFQLRLAKEAIVKLNAILENELVAGLEVTVLKEDFSQRSWIGPTFRTALDQHGKRYAVFYEGQYKDSFPAKLYLLESNPFGFRQRLVIVPLA